MAVGLSTLPRLFPVPGIRLATTSAGIRKRNRKDLVIIECATNTRVAGVFTNNKLRAAPVVLAHRHLAGHSPRACIINTGFANAATGQKGLEDALACCQALAEQMHCQTEEILPFSTGVIGERLPVDRIINAIPDCLAKLDADGWKDAAHGIMTTDTVAKAFSVKTSINGKGLTITGIVKGSGMIRPDMATMLAFVATDAKLSAEVITSALQEVTRTSFNRITVDGDTSTNDACLLFATGQGELVIENDSEDSYQLFVKELGKVFLDLAQAIIRDAEGITKFITIRVTNGLSESDCLEVAYTVAHSPLVKTAFFASDPNWGRILAAVGRAPVKDIDIDSVSVYLDDVCIARSGAVADDYSEAAGKNVMSRDEITIRIDLGTGQSQATVWTSDLSHDYVTINAEYRT
ncbi:MAG: bifunctional glutamate N-acetyltransferase/amino-acid acetyltransferase ArgJ [Gammaproteobacteria bacterium]|nr:bifunctional glutamate N-acetyltransferase/amino-acid acetyltransferase ArgJ [Gammaproteobacteria bacterium]